MLFCIATATGSYSQSESELMGHKFAPIWSSDGNWISFSFDFEHQEHRFKIYLIKPDGTDLTSFFDKEGSVSDFNLRGQVLFASNEGGSDNVYRIEQDGSSLTKLTDSSLPFSDRDAAWSPDGKHIAYNHIDRSKGYVNDIWIMQSDGTGKRNLTNTVKIQEGAFPVTWSADSRWIYFNHVVSNRSQIFRIQNDGTNKIQVTDDSANNFRPSPSRAGNKIAFISNRTGTRDQSENRIFVMNDDGSDLRQIGDVSPIHGTLSWDPEGNRIAFNAFSGDFVEIFTISVDGDSLRQITTSPPQQLIEVLSKGDLDQAEELFTSFKKIGQDKQLFIARSMIALGYEFLGRGDVARAIASFRYCTSTYGGDSNGWGGLGEAYMKAGELQKAIDSFHTSLSLSPPESVKQNSIKRLAELGVEIK